MSIRALHTDSTRGFTLIELLVGLAIFSTIMAGVTIMFNSAVRTTKQGYQNQRAFENVRGAFSLIEEDLTRSFSSRQTGHKHTFYGTPFGFTFVGLVPTEGTQEFNTARISYVVYGQFDDAGELTKTFQSQASENDPSITLNTYSLIRYVEIEQDGLDSYPVTWSAQLPASEGVGNLSDLLVSAAQQVMNEGSCVESIPISGGTPAEDIVRIYSEYECLERAINAKRQELWLRMLAGDPRLPDFWEETTGTVRIGELSGTSMNPADYIVAENLMFIDRNLDQNLNDGTEFDPEKSDNRDAYEILAQSGSAPVENQVLPFDGFTPGYHPPFIDAQRRDAAIIEFRDPAAYPNTAWDNYQTYALNHPFVPAQPYSPTNYFFAYREYDAEAVQVDDTGANSLIAVDNAGNLLVDQDPVTLLPTGLPNVNIGGVDYLARSEQQPRLFAFWNDIRNLTWNRFLNENYVQNIATQPLGADERSTVPDVMDPALPESVLLEFAVFYPSAYPGAPDFQRVFLHRINLPTAYRRKGESQWTQLIRDAEGRQ